MRQLSSVVDGVLAVVGLAEHHLVALLLTSDNEVSNLIITCSENTVLVKTEVESHVCFLASLFVPTFPDFLGVHFESESIRHSLEFPSAFNGTTTHSSGIVD